MNTPITYDNAATGFGLAASGAKSLRGRFHTWLDNRRRIERITFELGCYTDRELADLGLSRGDIPAVARGTFRRA